MRALRQGLSLSMAERQALIDLFFAHIAPSKGSVIAGYWPAGGECDARVIMGESLRRGYQCALPVVQRGSRILRFSSYANESVLQSGVFGIHEPAGQGDIMPDIVIVPLLAFDGQGHRLGQGGGYYDATLAVLRAQKPVIAVGLAYAQQECQDGAFVVEDHDQKLDWILTPAQMKAFS